MMYPTTNDGLAFFQASMMTLSDDGLIRLTVETLRTIPFTHLLSGLDEHDGSPPICEAASLDSISGYTEWVSTTSPVITLGWDWWLDPSAVPPVYTPIGEPRSNVMIVDAQHRDLGRRRSDAALAMLISTWSWQVTVEQHIRSRYA
jgi:hypothetical protein